MADYVILRRGRNALSTATHAMLNIGLAVTSTILTVVSANWVFAILLVIEKGFNPNIQAPLTTLTNGLFGIKTINSFDSNSFFIFCLK